MPTSRTAPAAPFAPPSPLAASALRQAIAAATRIPEPQAVAAVLAGARLPAEMAPRAQALATRVAQGLRERKASAGRAGLVQNLLQEYALSSQEGVALMCLAEALLRIPDAATRDTLIRDKISRGQWARHLGHSGSLFVNAATWGLLITGKLVGTHSENGLSASIGRLVSLGGEPLIRKGVDMAMRMMGEQFVTGETIEEALDNARHQEQQGFTHSFDMLGEAAMTAADAERYRRDYERAIHAIGTASAGRGIFGGPGISIKLSALHPRYARAQRERVMAELYPVLVRLCALAKRHDIGLNIDAEEADRLEISLDLLEQLAFEPQLQGWNGLGFVIQAYQKRCPHVIAHVIDLARRAGRRIMVRLVKGAYWDSEIKRAQLDGQADYPVYTRKPHTDASYIACARLLLAAPDAVYPQFATHNAHTLAAIHELADPATWTPGQYEFQCLHGMGEPLYEQVVGAVSAGKLGRPCRIYAPVGTHETLLAYLVRRLLENGANTSFVNRVADLELPIAELVRDPVAVIDAWAAAEGGPGRPHPAIPLPGDLYGSGRPNARGLDLADDDTLATLDAALQASRATPLAAAPMLVEGAQPAHGMTATLSGGGSGSGSGIGSATTAAITAAVSHGPASTAQPVRNPADHADLVGTVRQATPAEVDAALAAASRAAADWAATAPAERAAALRRAADRLEAQQRPLMALLMREAGKTASNAIAEVREAVDFLRYYADQAEGFDPATHRALGPVVCISPWNFPLAIFVGQVVAALAAGNTVLAKPAEQTPLVAAQAVQALWDAGVPRAVVQLLPGDGAEVGARLVADGRIRGVLFTGSTEVARLLQRALAGRTDGQGRALPLIAETGGQNAMVVDSSALTEQVVTDVLASAFDSAGQRCSALRVLCLQDEIADRTLEMLLGAMAELRVGDPTRLATDIGPVIDAEARAGIERHIAAMRAQGRRVHQICAHTGQRLDDGTHVLPTVIEIEDLAELQREVFGPVLHVLRWRRDELDGLLAQINGTGYGLTMGLHTRIDETIARVVQSAHAGNVYVNRNIVGAVVGVQPFGGEGLSGTGPKAGGPLYLYRLLAERPADAAQRAVSQAAGTPDVRATAPANAALQSLIHWVGGRDRSLIDDCRALAARAPSTEGVTLTGPTGERNVWRLAPREAVLGLADTERDRLLQLAATLAVGSRAVWPIEAEALHGRLPDAVRQQVTLVLDWTVPAARFDAVLLHGSTAELASVQASLARRDGAVISVERLTPGERDIPLERLVIERSLSVNTAAAGGNASLMTIG
ncbi:MAG: trifunctional transcriptional regulator/proline dehydrogenase/L-glutamate gamma-semialdehyde [Pseudomonadota bacterium]